MLTLRSPEKSFEQLRAMAASGASGVARKAQAQLRQLMSDRLAAELALSRAERGGLPSGSDE